MIKSIPNFGAIAPGSTQLASTLTYGINQNVFTVEGELTTTDGVIYPILESLELADGVWRVELGQQGENGPEVMAIGLGLPDPNWRTIQAIAGFGTGVMVVGGAIVGDIYVLTVTDPPPNVPD